MRARRYRKCALFSSASPQAFTKINSLLKPERVSDKCSEEVVAVVQEVVAAAQEVVAAAQEVVVAAQEGVAAAQELVVAPRK